MSNHVHMIAKAEGNYSLPDILRDFKKFTSKAIFMAISENYSESG
jgi:REP element-mobilizing transposase RayT